MRIVLLLACALLSATALAAPLPDTAQPSPLDGRDQWQSQQKLLRQVIRVDIPRSTHVDTTWLLWERTPSGRLKIIASKAPAAPPEFLFLQQDGQVLVMQGENADQPIAPWMLGMQLFGQPLEPSILQSWTLGLPGSSFQVGAQPAEITLDHNDIHRIAQEGWTVQYEQWHAPVGDRPALPKSFRICSVTTCAQITTFINQADIQVPAGYQEFTIR